MNILVILLGYLMGSIPTANIVARALKGVDLLRHGSGTVGASNVSVILGPKIALAVGTFDCLFKGTLPVGIAKLTGLSPDEQAFTGIACVAGHNWSLFLGFRGGRGIATTVGVLLISGYLVLFPLAGIVVPGWLATHSSAIWIGLGTLTLPLWAYLLYGDAHIIFLSSTLVALLVIKRLLSNWQGLLPGQPLRKTLLYRLLFDRDTARREDWIHRTGGDGPNG